MYLRIPRPPSMAGLGTRSGDANFFGGSGWTGLNFRTVWSADDSRFCRSLGWPFNSCQCISSVGAGPIVEPEKRAPHPWQIRGGRNTSIAERKLISSDLQIALCADVTILPGLHATLFSLTQRLGSRQNVVLTLFVDDLTKKECQELTETVAKAGGVRALKFVQVDLSDFAALRPLHGNLMNYMRLRLPELLPKADRILYLDSDLYVHTDLCLLFHEDLKGSPLGAVDAGTLKWCIDHHFYPKVGLNEGDRSFNSGVLLLDAEIWRNQDIGGQALAFGRLHHVHDQTVLNALFSRSFHPLPERYNRILGADHAPVKASDGVYHFLASPKPWDLWGKYIHRNWHLWHEAIIHTHFRPTHFRIKHFTDCLSRTWLLRRSYARTMFGSFGSGRGSLAAN
jgi:lipopolysaccharide biosynthesis glycosyltransferase